MTIISSLETTVQPLLSEPQLSKLQSLPNEGDKVQGQSTKDKAIILYVVAQQSAIQLPFVLIHCMSSNAHTKCKQIILSIKWYG